MVEHTQETMPGTIEVVRPVAPGEGLVRADEDARAGAELLPAGRRLRAQDVGLLAAAGATEVRVHARPRVAIVSTGDEVVPPGTEDLAIGQIRDATASALAALVRDAGGDPDPRGIVPDDRDALAAVLRDAVASCDVVVVSAGSSVGARDETAAVVAGLGEPGIWTHGIALRPGKPTLLADCGGVPVIGLPGNPRSALVVFRVIGMPIVRLVGGMTDPPPEPTVRARLERERPVGGRPPRRRAGHGPRRRRLAALRGLGAPDDPHGRRRVHRRPGRRDRPARGQRGRRHPVHLENGRRLRAAPHRVHGDHALHPRRPRPPRRSPPGARPARPRAAPSAWRPCASGSTRRSAG